MKDLFMRLWEEEEGQDLVEYGLLLLFVFLICVTVVKGLGTALSTVFKNASTSVS